MWRSTDGRDRIFDITCKVARSEASDTAVPRPPKRWKSRVLLPLLPLVLLALAGLALGYPAREALRPALAVEVVPIVIRGVAETQAFLLKSVVEQACPREEVNSSRTPSRVRFSQVATCNHPAALRSSRCFTSSLTAR
jgi:hypothetical protein